ncbi:UPF0193 protein EVG1 homolog [Diorhabda carinulata]|uniref:UPF0193 protein EVG1 homolog n=1 Tax=Diorhabda sublineata TaxID=1163346 RepID=UPI0024E13862|nr:UPF0193 protein EVG1 homolog [Diorhabda sublineata]XP_057667036.1 UPF0193 protein EVG1 homolog [Diorhabda carinulata]
MEWPSKNIPKGGFLQPAKCKYTPEKHEFIKLLVQESKMTLSQNKKNNYFLRTGEPFPSKSKIRHQLPEVTIRPGSSKKRSKNDIVNSGVYERERYVPRPCLFDREKEKEKLQNKMAFNGEIVVKKSKVIEKKVNQETKQEVNRFDQLVQEIKEREEWLEEMDRLGQGDKYRQIIELQIQEKVREMNRMKCAS